MLSKGKFLPQEMQAVPAGWSASALTHFIPRREGEEATSTVSVGCTVRAHDSSTFTTLQVVQLERTSLNL